MNACLIKLVVMVLILAIGIKNGSAQIRIRGYASCVFVTGSNLFNNPIVVTSSNSLSQVFPSLGGETVPEGTTVSLWNPTTLSFDTRSTFSNSAWSVDLMLPPGTGALVVAPLPFTNTIAGFVLNHDGSFLTNNIETLPNVFSGPNGVYLFGDACPTVDTGTNIFLNILGRMPFVGEQVTQLSGTNTFTSTYLGNGMWDSVPFLGVGKAAFFNIKSEPPPRLTIIYTNNQAIVSWPSTVASWTLQTNNNLAAGTWGNYAGPVINNTVTNSPPTGNLFFRLSHP